MAQLGLELVGAARGSPSPVSGSSSARRRSSCSVAARSSAPAITCATASRKRASSTANGRPSACPWARITWRAPERSGTGTLRPRRKPCSRIDRRDREARLAEQIVAHDRLAALQRVGGLRRCSGRDRGVEHLAVGRHQAHLAAGQQAGRRCSSRCRASRGPCASPRPSAPSRRLHLERATAEIGDRAPSGARRGAARSHPGAARRSTAPRPRARPARWSPTASTIDPSGRT